MQTCIHTAVKRLHAYRWLVYMSSKQHVKHWMSDVHFLLPSVNSSWSSSTGDFVITLPDKGHLHISYCVRLHSPGGLWAPSGDLPGTLAISMCKLVGSLLINDFSPLCYFFPSKSIRIFVFNVHLRPCLAGRKKNYC